jgi:hypothetical protein
MYKVTYYATQKKDVVFFKWFKTFRESTEFSNALKIPEAIIEIKFYDELDPNSPRPTTNHLSD